MCNICNLESEPAPPGKTESLDGFTAQMWRLNKLPLSKLDDDGWATHCTPAFLMALMYALQHYTGGLPSRPGGPRKRRALVVRRRVLKYISQIHSCEDTRLMSESLYWLGGERALLTSMSVLLNRSR